MGELFANMDKMDIQAERRNTREARQALEKAYALLIQKNDVIDRLEAEKTQLKEQEASRGELRGMVKLTCQKLAKGKTVPEIAEELETTEDGIARIYNAAKEYAPNYDVDAIVTKIFCFFT